MLVNNEGHFEDDWKVKERFSKIPIVNALKYSILEDMLCRSWLIIKYMTIHSHIWWRWNAETQTIKEYRIIRPCLLQCSLLNMTWKFSLRSWCREQASFLSLIEIIQEMYHVHLSKMKRCYNGPKHRSPWIILLFWLFGDTKLV